MTRRGNVFAAACLAASAPGGAAYAGGPCPWDCQSVPDGTVAIHDLLALLAQWGLTTPCDLDGAGVGVTDLLAVLANWGSCPPAGACCDPALHGCTLVTPEECAAAGGTYAGNGTTCADGDSDRIPNVFELGDCAPSGPCFTGTDPGNSDTDNDGIADGNEAWGTLSGLDLPALGANPCHKDILLELDWVYGTDSPADRNKPHANQVARLVAAFADAPNANPDGVNGITLHVDTGQPPFGGGNSVPDPNGDTVLDVNGSFNAGEYYPIKIANFAANRNGVFHYGLMCDAYSINGTYQNSSGLGELPGDDVIVSMGQWATGDDNFIGNTIMHELGHNLNLRHGGFENRNFKPNYNSVMNYWYHFCGTDLDFDVIPDGGLDYSRNQNVPLDEDALDEPAGVTGAGPGIDWSNDGDALDFLDRNINCRLTDTFANSSCRDFFQQNEPCGTTGQCADFSCDNLLDHDDWHGINFSGVGDSDLALPEIIHCLLEGPPAR